MSLTRTESDACDLVQQTFLTWATKGHQLQDLSKVKSWLFTTLHRAFLESRRRSTRFPHLEITEAEAELPSVEPDLVSHLDAQDALQLLSRVDEQFQAAVGVVLPRGLFLQRNRQHPGNSPGHRQIPHRAGPGPVEGTGAAKGRITG